MFLCFYHCILSHVGVYAHTTLYHKPTISHLSTLSLSLSLILSFPMSLPKCLTGSAYDRPLKPPRTQRSLLIMVTIQLFTLKALFKERTVTFTPNATTFRTPLLHLHVRLLTFSADVLSIMHSRFKCIVDTSGIAWNPIQ